MDLTKRDLLRYLVLVAPTLVPYLDGRGLTVQRYPNGIGQKGFWQKDLPKHAPEWVPRWTYHHREEGPKDYPVVDGAAGRTTVWGRPTLPGRSRCSSAAFAPATASHGWGGTSSRC